MSNLVKLIGVTVCIALFSPPTFAQQDDSTSQSQVNVKKQVRTLNRQTEHAVRKQLAATKGLSSNGITVVARGGVVTLSGSVPDAPQIQMAEDAAHRAPQVRSVANHIVIREHGS
ncbi:BON domain-containing protein [Paraburkholderia sediminicola]|uniref:BON domain-containing protein n=1 Tax=Paraburkholderia sediminicola TaxID=458836 RepID=UPI0038BC1031